MGFFKSMKDAMSGQGTGAMTMPTMGDVDAVNAQGQEYRRLAKVGLAGNAVITSATDTGERAAGNIVAHLELQVTPEGGEVYPVTLRYIIAGDEDLHRCSSRLVYLLDETELPSVTVIGGAAGAAAAAPATRRQVGVG